MTLHDWLDREENKGKGAWLGAKLGRSRAAVSLWRNEGVPMVLMPRIAKLTKHAVSTDDMLRHAMACRLAQQAAEKEHA